MCHLAHSSSLGTTVLLHTTTPCLSSLSLHTPIGVDCAVDSLRPDLPGSSQAAVQIVSACIEKPNLSSSMPPLLSLIILTLLIPDCGIFPTPSDSLWHQLSVLQFNWILTVPHGDSIRSHRVKGCPPLQMPTASSISPSYSFKLEGPMTSSLLGFHYLLEWLIEFRKILIFTCVLSFPRWLRW